MKKLSLLLAIICVLLYCSACFAGNRYVEVGLNEYIHVYLDTETLKKDESNNSFNCWVKYLYNDKGQKYYEMGKVRYEICNFTFYPNRTFTLHTYLAYDKYDKNIKDVVIPYYETKNKTIPPESDHEAIWEYLYK